MNRILEVMVSCHCQHLLGQLSCQNCLKRHKMPATSDSRIQLFNGDLESDIAQAMPAWCPL